MSANGNLAWLGVRGIPIQVQPAEVVKLTFILLLARQLVWMKGRGDMKSIPAVGLLAGNLLVTIGLYYVISSDMGSALVYVCIFACMAFAAGVALRWFALGIFGAGAGFYLLWELDKIPPYMKERFQVLVDHSLYPLGAGWQQTRSLMAIGGGSGDAGVPDRLQRGDVPVCAAGGGPDAALHQLWRLVGGDAVHRHGHGLRHPEALPAGLAALAA